MSFNDPGDLKTAYKILGEQFNDNELQDELDRAHRKLDSRVGRVFEEVERAELDDQEDFKLAFTEIQSFDSVRILGENENVDNADYTGPLESGGTDGQVSFTTSYAEDNISRGTPVKFKYVPDVYIDLELWYAVLGLARKNTLQTRDGSSSINVDEAKEAISDLETGINGKAGNRIVLDHQPRFHPTHTNYGV